MASTKECIPQQTAIDIVESLNRIKPPIGQNYSVMAYFLSNDTSTGVHGMVYNLGNYATREEAKDRCLHLIKTTDYAHVVSWPVCSSFILSENPITTETDYYDSTEDRIINKVKNEWCEKFNKLAADQEKRQADIEDEKITENQPTHVNHYIHNMFHACKLKQHIENYQAKIEELEEKYQTRINKIVTQYQQQPHMKDEWKTVIRGQLSGRGEENIYHEIMATSSVIENIIFGVQDQAYDTSPEETQQEESPWCDSSSGICYSQTSTEITTDDTPVPEQEMDNLQETNIESLDSTTTGDQNNLQNESVETTQTSDDSRPNDTATESTQCDEWIPVQTVTTTSNRSRSKKKKNKKKRKR